MVYSLGVSAYVKSIKAMFKKRPNFLNSMPTSIESALRLLNTPSVRFWQQNPISLWALVFELHPLKWAHAQAVCRISDKVTMKELEEQCACMKFCCKLGKHFTQTFQLLNQAYREDCMSQSPWPKKSQLIWSKFKVMLVVFFDWKGTVRHEFVPRGQMVNKQRYLEVLACLRNAVCTKRPELWKNQTWMLHHDNAPAHALLLIRSYLAKHQTSVVPHPPYSPDLAPSDFFLFPKLKTTLKWCHFQTTVTLSLIWRTACALAQFSRCSSVTNAQNKMGQMAVCCQNLMLGVLSRHSTLSVLVDALFKKFSLFLNMPCT